MFNKARSPRLLCNYHNCLFKLKVDATVFFVFLIATHIHYLFCYCNESLMSTVLRFSFWICFFCSTKESVAVGKMYTIYYKEFYRKWIKKGDMSSLCLYTKKVLQYRLNTNDFLGICLHLFVSKLLWIARFLWFLGENQNKYWIDRINFQLLRTTSQTDGNSLNQQMTIFSNQIS